MYLLQPPPSSPPPPRITPLYFVGHNATCTNGRIFLQRAYAHSVQEFGMEGGLFSPSYVEYIENRLWRTGIISSSDYEKSFIRNAYYSNLPTLVREGNFEALFESLLKSDVGQFMYILTPPINRRQLHFVPKQGVEVIDREV